jgi:arylsulfatase A-like enzyme
MALAMSAATAFAADGRRPNVLLVTVDTLRADHLSSYGYHLRTSPHIDTLARDGTRFERVYTTIPLTGPAHISLFTSRYPQETGVRRNGVAMPDDRQLVVLPQLLRANGYRAGAFVSGWPLTGRLTHINEWFDHYDEELTRTYQMFNSSRWAEDVTPRALEWLKQNGKADKPFFLWVHYFDPHSPYDFREHFHPTTASAGAVPQPKLTDEIRQRFRDYDSEIAYTDHHVGKLLQAIDGMGLRESTLVVLTADHGESLGEHDYVGHGRYLYENILRIPLIVRFPGKVPAGKVVKTPVSLVDIAPTITELTVRDVVDARKARLTFAGRSLAPAFAGDGRLTERPIYYVTFPGKKGFAPSWLSWMWVSNEELPLRFGRIDGTTKSIWSPQEQELLVFDVHRDPWELKPRRAAQSASTYRDRTGHLKTWFARTETRAEEQQLSRKDMEVLKTLGYVQ